MNCSLVKRPTLWRHISKDKTANFLKFCSLMPLIIWTKSQINQVILTLLSGVWDSWERNAVAPIRPSVFIKTSISIAHFTHYICCNSKSDRRWRKMAHYEITSSTIRKFLDESSFQKILFITVKSHTNYSQQYIWQWFIHKPPLWPPDNTTSESVIEREHVRDR